MLFVSILLMNDALTEYLFLSRYVNQHLHITCIEIQYKVMCSTSYFLENVLDVHNETGLVC